MPVQPNTSAATSGRGVRRWLPIAVLLLPALVRADPWQALTEADLPESLGERAGQVLASARAGDVTARASIAFRMLSQGDNSRARILMQDTLGNMPEASDDRLQDAQRRHLAMMLAPMLLEGKGGPADPEAGLALLVPFARRGVPPAVEAMAWYTRNLPQLPASARLAEAWETAQEEGAFSSHAELVAAELAGLPPEDAAGAAECPDRLADPDRVLAPVRAAEADGLADPAVAQARMREALASLASPGADPVSEALSLYFEMLTARQALMMVAEMRGVALRFDEALAEPALIGLFLTSAPPDLVTAMVLDSLGWRARCDGNLLHIEADPERVPVSGQPLLLGPRRSVDPPGALHGSATGEIVWHFGTTYQGDIAQGRPHGRGTLVLPTGSRLSGEFRDGLPHGEAVYAFADGSESYRGGYRHGHRHGPGRLARDRHEDTDLIEEGRFEHGHLVEGSAQLPGAGGAATVVTWRGAFARGLAHGEGTCSVDGLTYRCGFAAGDLVSIGGIALYPRPD